MLKAGEAPYYKTFEGPTNRWGDYSATVVDPSNDTDLWTIQEYAAMPTEGVDRWGTWWGRIGPEPCPGTITIDGDPVTVRIRTPGQDCRVSFSGRQGQRLGLGMTEVTIPSSDVSIRRPLPGDQVLAIVRVFPPGGTLDAPPLPDPGTQTYSIVVDPLGFNTGRMTLWLSEEKPYTIAVDGDPVTVEIERRGQNARVSFSGRQDQRLGLGMTEVTIPSSDVCVRRPLPGDQPLACVRVFPPGGTLDVPPLPEPGTQTYSITVDPLGLNTGQMTLTLSQRASPAAWQQIPHHHIVVMPAGRADAPGDIADQRSSVPVGRRRSNEVIVSLTNGEGNPDLDTRRRSLHVTTVRTAGRST